MYHVGAEATHRDHGMLTPFQIQVQEFISDAIFVRPRMTDPSKDSIFFQKQDDSNLRRPPKKHVCQGKFCIEF